MTKIKDEVTSLESKKTSRRKFFKAAAATGAVAAASLAMPNISVAQGTVTLKCKQLGALQMQTHFLRWQKITARE